MRPKLTSAITPVLCIEKLQSAGVRLYASSFDAISLVQSPPLLREVFFIWRFPIPSDSQIIHEPNFPEVEQASSQSQLIKSHYYVQTPFAQQILDLNCSHPELSYGQYKQESSLLFPLLQLILFIARERYAVLFHPAVVATRNQLIFPCCSQY